MPAKLVILPTAKQDMNDGFRWYEGQRAGVGKRFLAAVKARLAAVRRMPKAHQVIHGTCRRAVIHNWPYIIIYDYDEPNDTVIVYAVFHTSQDPAKWQQRLP